jgi:hypothetical protein
MILAFFAALIVGIMLLVRRLASARGASGGVTGGSALEIPQRRYIAGEIDEAVHGEGGKRMPA